MPEPKGPGGPLAPQYLADQLTLFKLGEGRVSPPITTAPPKFFTFWHHSSHTYKKRRASLFSGLPINPIGNNFDNTAQWSASVSVYKIKKFLPFLFLHKFTVCALPLKCTGEYPSCTQQVG